MIPVLYTTFNRLEMTKKTLPVLFDNLGEKGKLVIIDNGSTDNTAEFITEFIKNCDKTKILSVRLNSENVFISGAMRQFFDIALLHDCEYFAKVDNDTIAPEGWLDKLYNVIDSNVCIDVIQAKHFFIIEGVSDWDALIASRPSSKFDEGNLIPMEAVGGSGIIARLCKVVSFEPYGEPLTGWPQFQIHNKLSCALYDGITVDLLDMKGYNTFKINDLDYSVKVGRINVDSIPSVSIIIPIVREDRAKGCIAAIKEHIGTPEENYEIIAEVDTGRIGCPKMVKKLYDKSKHDLVMFLGDDTVPQEGFLIEAVQKMNKFDGNFGLVGLNDGNVDGKKLATHWLVHKRFVDFLENSEPFFSGYNHLYCDCELTDIAKEVGRYSWAESAKIIHNHPIFDKGKYEDDFYRECYSKENSRKDHRLYLKRRRARTGYFKLGIGFPITDVKVYTSFMVSWTLMDKPDYTLLMPKFPGPIDKIRNNLVTQALNENCTHLLMMDTDQNYPKDVIPKLLSHKKEVVAVGIHRRYPPFDIILYRGKVGDYHHVPDDECLSGDLIEIDATGCGCILYDTDVFFAIGSPWFEERYLPDGRIVGEDIDFCWKLRDAGFKMYADTSIKIGHISHVEINDDFYLLYKKIKGFDWRPPPLEPDLKEV
jgi:GT2 family glycosyltransferase